jgi:hypothetical protein
MEEEYGTTYRQREQVGLGKGKSETPQDKSYDYAEKFLDNNDMAKYKEKIMERIYNIKNIEVYNPAMLAFAIFLVNFVKREKDYMGYINKYASEYPIEDITRYIRFVKKLK